MGLSDREFGEGRRREETLSDQLECRTHRVCIPRYAPGISGVHEGRRREGNDSKAIYMSAAHHSCLRKVCTSSRWWGCCYGSYGLGKFGKGAEERGWKRQNTEERKEWCSCIGVRRYEESCSYFAPEEENGGLFGQGKKNYCKKGENCCREQDNYQEEGGGYCGKKIVAKVKQE